MTRSSGAGSAGVEHPAPGHPVVLYDDSCGFCAWSVRFVVAHDPQARFRFASNRSALSERLVGSTAPGTVVLLDEHGRVHTRSTATLEIARRLPAPWRLAAVLLAVPRPLRDAAYGVVARNRRRLAGDRACPLPTEQVRARLLA